MMKKGLLILFTLSSFNSKGTDLLVRETIQANQPLFYIYDDGTIEKKIIIE